MLNRIIKKMSVKDVNNFTSHFGLAIRRYFHKVISILFIIVMRLYYKRKIIVENKPKVEKKKNYI